MESKPKFGLFDRVNLVTVTDCAVHRDEVTITGVLFQPPGWQGVMWCYQVTFYDKPPSSPWLVCPYAEIVAESELEAIV